MGKFLVFTIPFCVKICEAGINAKRDIEHISMKDVVPVDMTVATLKETHKQNWIPGLVWLQIRLGH